jgi:hypothetical protein
MSGRNKIARLDTMLNSILRAFTKSWGTAPAFAPLRMDLGVMPIFARMAGQRIRAFTKFRNSATFISTLLGFPSNSRRRSWASGTKSWCRSFCPKALQSSSPRDARDEVSTLLSRRAAAQPTTPVLSTPTSKMVTSIRLRSSTMLSSAALSRLVTVSLVSSLCAVVDSRLPRVPLVWD